MVFILGVLGVGFTGCCVTGAAAISTLVYSIVQNWP